MSNYVIALEGIPGSGKSALLSEISKFNHVRGKRVVTVFENKENSLKNYCADDPDYCTLANQLFILVSRVMTLNRLMKMHKDCIFVTERSAEADYMFVKMLYESNKMSTIEYEVYQLIYDILAPSRVPLTGRIITTCDSTVSMARCASDTELKIELFDDLSDNQDYIFRGATQQFHVNTTELETLDYVDDAVFFIDSVVRNNESERLTYAFLLWSIFLVTVSVVVTQM